MRLQPIDDAHFGEAVAILARGFPDRSPSFWEQGLRRLAEYRKETGGPPIGQMLVVDDQAVGVILTIASKRHDGARSRDVVNLSSWYVDEKYRWLAPRMLESVVADDTVVFTDLSPNEHTAKINERLGFRTAAEGVFLFFLPWGAIFGRARGQVVPWEKIPHDALPAAESALLARHRDLGCIAAALYDGRRYQPLLFQPSRRMGLPVARLLLAPSRQVVADHILGIARFLLRRGLFFLSLHGDSITTAAGGILWNRSASVQVKGKWDPDRVDHTYSELVFLRL